MSRRRCGGTSPPRGGHGMCRGKACKTDHADPGSRRRARPMLHSHEVAVAAIDDRSDARALPRRTTMQRSQSTTSEPTPRNASAGRRRPRVQRHRRHGSDRAGVRQRYLEARPAHPPTRPAEVAVRAAVGGWIGDHAKSGARRRRLAARTGISPTPPQLRSSGRLRRGLTGRRFGNLLQTKSGRSENAGRGRPEAASSYSRHDGVTGACRVVLWRP